MKRLAIGAGVGVLLTAGFVVWLLWPRSKPAPNPKYQTAEEAAHDASTETQGFVDRTNRLPVDERESAIWRWAEEGARI